MLKLWGDSVLRALEFIFKSSFETGWFLSEWKEQNVVPVHKKSDKQSLENNRIISLLPICGKIFEGLICHKMFEDFIENDLIYHDQS